MYVHTRVMHTLLLEIFITIHRLAFWPSRWPTGSVQTKLQDSFFLITECQKELFVAAVPSWPIAAFPCLGLSFNIIIQLFLCLHS